jgi:hypothetical protein
MRTRSFWIVSEVPSSYPVLHGQRIPRSLHRHGPASEANPVTKKYASILVRIHDVLSGWSRLVCRMISIISGLSEFGTASSDGC